MQWVALETRVRNLPFCPKPIPQWRHTFPGGFHIHPLTAPRPTPSHTPHSREDSGLASFSRGSPPTHLLRGSEVTIQTRTHYHNLAAKEQTLLIFGTMAPILNMKGSDVSQWVDSFIDRTAADVEL